MKRRGQAFFSNLGLGDLEVPDRRRAGKPGRAKDILLFAVQGTKMGRSPIHREEKYGFLKKDLAMHARAFSQALFSFPTLKAFSARPQRPKQVLFPPVTNTNHS